MMNVRYGNGVGVEVSVAPEYGIVELNTATLGFQQLFVY